MYFIQKNGFYLYIYNPYLDLWTESKAIALQLNKAIALQYVGSVGGEVVAVPTFIGLGQLSQRFGTSPVVTGSCHRL